MKKTDKNDNQAGMSKFIRSLFADGVKKVEAYGRTLKKFPIVSSRYHFDARWDAAVRRSKSARVENVLAKKRTPKAASALQSAA